MVLLPSCKCCGGGPGGDWGCYTGTPTDCSCGTGKQLAAVVVTVTDVSGNDITADFAVGESRFLPTRLGGSPGDQYCNAGFQAGYVECTYPGASIGGTYSLSVSVRHVCTNPDVVSIWQWGYVTWDGRPIGTRSCGCFATPLTQPGVTVPVGTETTTVNTPVYWQESPLDDCCEEAWGNPCDPPAVNKQQIGSVTLKYDFVWQESGTPVEPVKRCLYTPDVVEDSGWTLEKSFATEQECIDSGCRDGGWTCWGPQCYAPQDIEAIVLTYEASDVEYLDMGRPDSGLGLRDQAANIKSIVDGLSGWTITNKDQINTARFAGRGFYGQDCTTDTDGGWYINEGYYGWLHSTALILELTSSCGDFQEFNSCGVQDHTTAYGCHSHFGLPANDGGYCLSLDYTVGTLAGEFRGEFQTTGTKAVLDIPKVSDPVISYLGDCSQVYRQKHARVALYSENFHTIQNPEVAFYALSLKVTVQIVPKEGLDATKQMVCVAPYEAPPDGYVKEGGPYPDESTCRDACGSGECIGVPGCCVGGVVVDCVDVNTGQSIPCPPCGGLDWTPNIGEIFWDCWPESDEEWCKAQEAASPDEWAYLENYCTETFYSTYHESVFRVVDCPETAALYGPDTSVPECDTPECNPGGFRRAAPKSKPIVGVRFKGLSPEQLRKLHQENPLP